MKNSLLHIVDDLPTDRDRLGINILAEAIAQLLALEHTKTPVTTGVFGSWGSGKTSLLRMVKKHLDSWGHVRTAWFDLWHERFSPLPVAGLIQAVSALAPIKTGARRATKVLMESVADLFLRTATRDAVTSDQVRSRFQEHEFVTSANIRIPKILAEYNILVNSVLKEKQRLVVIIDDLDRCNKTEVVNLLDHIHHFLYVPKVAYLIAADREILLRAFGERYGAFAGQEFKQATALGIAPSDYLEKMIQLDFHIPRPSPSSWREYCRELFANLPASALLLKHIEKLPCNPRKAKLFHNRAVLSCDLLKRGNASQEVLSQCVKWLLIQTINPDLAAMMALTPETFVAAQTALRTRGSVRVEGMQLTITDVLALIDLSAESILTEEPYFSVEGLREVVRISGTDIRAVDRVITLDRTLSDIVERIHTANSQEVNLAMQELGKLPPTHRAAVLRDLRRRIKSINEQAQCASFDAFSTFMFYEVIEEAQEICRVTSNGIAVRVFALRYLYTVNQPVDPSTVTIIYKGLEELERTNQQQAQRFRKLLEDAKHFL